MPALSRRAPASRPRLAQAAGYQTKRTLHRLPLSISALGLLLIAVGTHTPKRRKAKKRAGKRKRKPRLGKGAQPSANVVPLRRRA